MYFIVFPLLVLIYDSFFVDGVLDISNYREVYGKAVNWKSLTNTVQLAFIVMIASVLVTFPMAWLVGRTDLPFKKAFRTILVASYMIPPYVGAIAWVQLLNPSVGYLNNIFKAVFGLSQAPFNIYTMGGLAWVLTLFYSPFAFITISRAMEKMDPTLEEAARISGSSPLRTLKDVTLPLMMPSIVAGGLLVRNSGHRRYAGQYRGHDDPYRHLRLSGGRGGHPERHGPGRLHDDHRQRPAVLHELPAEP